MVMKWVFSFLVASFIFFAITEYYCTLWRAVQCAYNTEVEPSMREITQL